MAQRQALELRCRAWQTGGVADGDVGLKDPAPYSDQSVPETTTTFQNIKKSKKEVAAAKKAALPCLRNLASYVSNQGRQVDAEMVLVSAMTRSTILCAVLARFNPHRQHLYNAVPPSPPSPPPPYGETGRG